MPFLLKFDPRSIALFSLLTAAACGSLVHVGRDGGNENTANAPSAPPKPAAEKELPAAPARTLKYAGLQFTVTKAAMMGAGTAEITLSVNNPRKEEVTISGALWTLRLAGGTTAASPYADTIDARDTKECKLHLSVPATATWNGAMLTLEEKDKEPAMVALDGPALPETYPLALAVTGEASTKDPAITYAISTANLDLDGAGERAAVGTRFLNLSVRMTDRDTDGSEQFAPEFFHLRIDGFSVAPEEIDNAILSSARSQDVVMSFVIPANSMNVELEVGKVDGETARIPIDLGTGGPQA